MRLSKRTSTQSNWIFKLLNVPCVNGTFPFRWDFRIATRRTNHIKKKNVYLFLWMDQYHRINCINCMKRRWKKANKLPTLIDWTEARSKSRRSHCIISKKKKKYIYMENRNYKNFTFTVWMKLWIQIAQDVREQMTKAHHISNHVHLSHFFLIRMRCFFGLIFFALDVHWILFYIKLFISKHFARFHRLRYLYLLLLIFFFFFFHHFYHFWIQRCQCFSYYCERVIESKS